MNGFSQSHVAPCKNHNVILRGMTPIALIMSLHGFVRRKYILLGQPERSLTYSTHISLGMITEPCITNSCFSFTY